MSKRKLRKQIKELEEHPVVKQYKALCNELQNYGLTHVIIHFMVDEGSNRRPLCNVKYNPFRGASWSPDERQVTCKRCLKMLEKRIASERVNIEE